MLSLKGCWKLKGEKPECILLFFPLRLDSYTDVGLILLLPGMRSSLVGVCSQPSPKFFPSFSPAVATGLISVARESSPFLCPQCHETTQFLGSISPSFPLASFLN